MAVTPERKLNAVPTFGLGTSTHWEPFQCSVNVCQYVSKYSPTAQSCFVPGTTVTLLSSLSKAGPGLATTLHCEPFQCSVNVCTTPLVWVLPTAHTLFVDTAAT